jgi:late competence protein required for DNA uptake (superfamily II DNA/RNA helicase)
MHKYCKRCGKRKEVKAYLHKGEMNWYCFNCIMQLNKENKAREKYIENPNEGDIL